MWSLKAARLHQYGQPLRIDDIETPVPKGEQVLVRVGGAGVCHSDVHFKDGEWQEYLPAELPLTIGHEIAGTVEQTGPLVNDIQKGDVVAVFGGWGCSFCKYCKSGDEQLCIRPTFPGLSRYGGGFAEYVLVPSYKFLINAGNLDPKEIAPLTDAGLTPYRAVKKVKHLLNPGAFALVLGVGGLGSYAIQYLKLLADVSVISVVRDEEKQKLAKKMGSDFVINSKTEDAGRQIRDITSNRGVDAAIDLVSSEDTVRIATSNLAKGGTVVLVGLMGRSVPFPVTEAVLNEFNMMGSLWGNYNELKEVIELAKMKKLKSEIIQYKLDDANNVLDMLKQGKVNGRAVLIP